MPEPGGAAELAGGAGLAPVADGDVRAPGDDGRPTGVVVAVTPPGKPDGASRCPVPPAPRLLPLMPPSPLRPEGPPRAGARAADRRAVRRSAGRARRRRARVRAGNDAHHDGCGHHDQAGRAGHQGLRVVQDPAPPSGPGRADRLRETLRTERACPIRHGQAMSQPGGRAVRQDPQHLLTESRQQRGYRNRAREQRRRQLPPLALPADLALLDMPADPLAHQHSQLPVPAGQHRVQAGAGRATGPGHDQRAERAFELAARP